MQQKQNSHISSQYQIQDAPKQLFNINYSGKQLIGAQNKDCESEDEIINQIKKIALEIFAGQSFKNLSDQLLLDFNQIDRKRNKKDQFNQNIKIYQQQQRKYSYTERAKYQQIVEDDWISCENYERNDQQKQYQIQGSIQDQQKAMKNPQKKKSEGKKQQTVNKPKINFKKHKQSLKKGINSFSQDPNYLKPIRNNRQQLLIQLECKKKEQQKHLYKSHQSHSRLEQLYKQKIPLYQKYLNDSQIKKIKITASRLQKEQDELNQFIGRPQVNTNREVTGNFEERKLASEYIKQSNKKKVLKQVMQPYTFAPKTNNKKEYKNIQSKIKKSWDKKQNPEIDNNMTGFYSSLLKNGNLFNEEENPNQISNVKIKNLHELSYILELEDFMEQ